MNYPNDRCNSYRKNSAIDGGKKTAAFSNIEYGGRGMSLKKISNIQIRFILKATLQLFTKSLRQYK